MFGSFFLHFVFAGSFVVVGGGGAVGSLPFTTITLISYISVTQILLSLSIRVPFFSRHVLLFRFSGSRS